MFISSLYSVMHYHSPPSLPKHSLHHQSSLTIKIRFIDSLLHFYFWLFIPSVNKKSCSRCFSILLHLRTSAVLASSLRDQPYPKHFPRIPMAPNFLKACDAFHLATLDLAVASLVLLTSSHEFSSIVLKRENH